MNERIRELAEQAVTEAAKYCQRKFDLSKEENETFALCFAEMILRECLELFEAAKVNQEDDVDYGLEEAKSIIKEHFGVEE